MVLLKHSANKAIINFPMVTHIRFKVLGIFSSGEYILSNALFVLILKKGFVSFVCVFALSDRLTEKQIKIKLIIICCT